MLRKIQKEKRHNFLSKKMEFEEGSDFMDLLDKVKLEDLSEEQKSIVAVMGWDVYKELVVNYGGQSVYIAKADTIIRAARDREIMTEFNGSNYATLASKYNLSIRAIRDIVDGSAYYSQYIKKNQVKFFN